MSPGYAQNCFTAEEGTFGRLRAEPKFRRLVLSYASEVYKSAKWYIAHEILYFESKSDKARAKRTVWENLILIRADSPEEAYEKALQKGQSNEHAVKIGSTDGYCKFKGLRDLVLIYDQLEDGAELEWRELEMTPAVLDRFVRPKGKLHAFNIDPSRKPQATLRPGVES